MLYPEVVDIKKVNIAIKIALIISVLLSLACLIVDFVIGFRFHWSILAIVGIVYTWINVMYSIKKNVNIASHVMTQILGSSVIMLVADYLDKYYFSWSVNWGLPIALMAGNVTMFILTIISHRKYFKYAIYHIIIFLLNLIPGILYILKISDRILPVILSLSIAIITLIVTIIICGKELKEEFIRVFHI